MNHFRFALRLFLGVGILWISATGCRSGDAAREMLASSQPADVGLAPYISIPEVEALCAPPAGWQAEPLRIGARSSHQSWLSPSRRTAYGVIRFVIPLPVGPDTVLPFFLKEMAKLEGSAILLDKYTGGGLPGLQLLTESDQYRTYSTLTTRGFRGWVIYAGTLRNEETNSEELELAQRARLATEVGISADDH
jgi:hypothetical protein